jgi:hypothetical protein
VRGVVDECGLYDIIDGGQCRDLWLEITPQSFNVHIKEGAAAVASLLVCAAVLTGICLGNACSCHEILRAQRPRPGLALTQLMVFKETPQAPPPGSPTAVAPGVFDDDGNALPLRLHKDSLVLSLRVPSMPGSRRRDSLGMADDASMLAGYEVGPIIDAPCTHCLWHGDPIHTQK